MISPTTWLYAAPITNKYLDLLLNLHNAGCGWYNFGLTLRNIYMDKYSGESMPYDGELWESVCEYWDSIIEDDLHSPQLYRLPGGVENFYKTLLQKIKCS